MDIRLLHTPSELSTYADWAKDHPQGSLWQSMEWKTFQEALGRRVRIYAAMEGENILASALVVVDRTVFGLSVWDIPRGPLGRMENGELIIDNDTMARFMAAIVHDAKKAHCLSLFLSPQKSFSIIHYPLSISRASARHEQPEASRIVDLSLSEPDILKQMKPKGRYNIALASRHGVRVEESRDVAAFHALLKETSGRDGFTVHSEKHYETFLKSIPGSFLLVAYPPTSYNLQATTSSPIAALLGVIHAKTGIYYYGASSYAHRSLMAPYLLQWEAMKRCKALDCTTYDLLGIAPPDATEDHPWAGVSSFKEKFGGTVVSYPQEQQVVLRPLTMKMLEWKRKVVG